MIVVLTGEGEYVSGGANEKADNGRRGDGGHELQHGRRKSETKVYRSSQYGSLHSLYSTRRFRCFLLTLSPMQMKCTCNASDSTYCKVDIFEKEDMESHCYK